MPEFVFIRRRSIGAGPAVCFVGLAPLLSDDSHTIRRYERWATAWGFGAVLAVNAHPLAVDARCNGLAAWVADQDESASNTNIAAVLQAATEAGPGRVVACWGSSTLAAASPATASLIHSGRLLHCLGTNLDGSPKHPSGRSLPAVPALVPWAPTRTALGHRDTAANTGRVAG